ncbi:putative F-box protein At5g55150 [Rutidosis leptorrhynchoides]|uniref:putative F-box protein At5g55150 n=1 Tax=Rutidosis leptorrhynchoides TaxID=125765 RepID=UPI003A9A3E82
MECSAMLLTELSDVVAHKSINFNKDDHLSLSLSSTAVQVATEVPYSNGLFSRLPSLLLAEKIEDREFRELYLLSDKTICKIRLPETYGKFCTSSFGWLLTVGDDTDTKLINPLSRETINLPKLETFPNFLKSSLGFCRIGDDKWTPIETGWGGRISDITCYDGRVYYFDSNFHIRSCDVYGEDNMVIVDVSRLPKEYHAYDNIGAYVLGLDDDDDDDTRKRLLVVIRETNFDVLADFETCKTTSFRVYEFDLQSKRWSKVNDLGNKTLFVGYSSSFWIQDALGVIKANCIYFTDDILYRYSKNGAADMGIYHMSGGTIEPHFTGESVSKVLPPIWIQPI